MNHRAMRKFISIAAKRLLQVGEECGEWSGTLRLDRGNPRQFLTFCLLTVVFCGAPSTGRAQQDANPDAAAAASADISRPYQPPAASKSVEIGNFYLKKKKYKAALSRFQEAVSTDPSYAPAYLGLGKAYDKIGLMGKALEAYHKYLDELPSAKQADEAKDVHKAINRLERRLTRPRVPLDGCRLPVHWRSLPPAEQPGEQNGCAAAICSTGRKRGVAPQAPSYSLPRCGHVSAAGAGVEHPRPL